MEPTVLSGIFQGTFAFVSVVPVNLFHPFPSFSCDLVIWPPRSVTQSSFGATHSWDGVPLGRPEVPELQCFNAVPCGAGAQRTQSDGIKEQPKSDVLHGLAKTETIEVVQERTVICLCTRSRG